MADASSSTTGGGGTENPTAIDPAAALEHMRGLLGAKDDTSRFVGLALLKSILDNQPLLRENVGQLASLWEAISPKFLDRLLRAGQNQRVTKEEARNIVDIAVAVLHTFTSLLPEEVRDAKRLLGRSPALVNVLIDSSPETTALILQTLLTFVSQPNGALEFMAIEDLSPLTEIAPQQSLVLDIFRLAWSLTATEPLEVPKVKDSINKTMPMFINSFNRTDAVTFVAFIGDTLRKLPLEALQRDPDWLQPLVKILRKLIMSRPTQAGRSAYTHMAAFLMQAYPLDCPPLLFSDGNASTNDAKPFSYLFINLILIDLRSSFPSLLSKLNTPEYPSISGRLSSALDVVLFFIGFLIRSLGDEDNSNAFNLTMSPDLLLKLRKSIAETMSLTIEYLRDRWDASVAGAPGLHPSARHGTAATSEGTRLTLTWDSINENVTDDSLIHASIRTLATYLREDENENLRKESAGLIDMFVELYQVSTSSDMDYRHAVLRGLEVILTTQEGIDGFLTQNGWQILSRDLSSVISGTSAAKDLSSDEYERGQNIVRVLLIVVDSESGTEPRENWMEIVKSTASMKPSTSKDSLAMDIQVAVLTLASALLTSSSKGMQKRYLMYTTAMLGLATQLQKEARKLRSQDKEDIREEISDVIMTLENLR